MSLALIGGLKPTLHYCGALGRRERLELSMVSPEFRKNASFGWKTAFFGSINNFDNLHICGLIYVINKES
jgi:hypothetical protein